MIAAYLAIGIAGSLASYRMRGFLRWWIAYEVGISIALKLIWLRWGVYDPLWRVAEPLGVVFAAAVVLNRCKPPRWPVYATLAACVHALAMGYPDRWPGDWLQAEIHLIAFCWLVLGLFLLSGKGNDLVLAMLFLGTSAAYYSMPWKMDLRVWLMFYQAGCYACMALVKPHHESGDRHARASPGINSSHHRHQAM